MTMPTGTLIRAVKKFERWVDRRSMASLATVRRTHPEFDTVVQRIREAGTDSLSHFGNGYTHEGGLTLQQNPDEFAALTLFLAERGPFERYMEIGSASGGACRFLNDNVGFGRVLSIDDGNHVRANEQAANFSHVLSLSQIICDSHTPPSRQFLRDTLAGDKLDVAFIDGDHSYEGVVMDIDLTLEFCRRGTLIIFHDTIACPPVRRAWDEAVRARRLKPIAEFIGEDRPLGISVSKVR